MTVHDVFTYCSQHISLELNPSADSVNFLNLTHALAKVVFGFESKRKSVDFFLYFPYFCGYMLEQSQSDFELVSCRSESNPIAFHKIIIILRFGIVEMIQA